ncbi:prepilin-type N-terminal cleavage/methylation domain-containing protein [Phaeobacter sp. J2-8]|uniref:prepilin-type N-terminal cleavage/methylation domain-containing protein n=1 Tax=Phaeobacter sp. J2-8 TaxID=2931394 RepID=UPI001FD14E43|nr:prepilin-type N-terminal cleavage/methylation domain-containing protein [Phaeobacter sp. J2-8]MCJ7874788.1 prepilin-type N-terminal cleavage/methylation domain-containing protein [Phaeobacter sp. J2-8]
MTPRRPVAADAGLSLIELVVAMAMFALVAVMGLQSLTGTIRVSERLTQIDTETTELGNALALLRNDLTSLVPMLFYPPQGAPRAAIDLSQDGTRLGLSIAGQESFTPSHTDRHRAEWSFDPAKGTLTRQFWPALVPAEQVGISPEMTVLRDVQAFGLRTYWPNVGWVAGSTPPISTQVSARPLLTDQDGPGAPPRSISAPCPLPSK